MYDFITNNGAVSLSTFILQASRIGMLREDSVLQIQGNSFLAIDSYTSGMDELKLNLLKRAAGYVILKSRMGGKAPADETRIDKESSHTHIPESVSAVKVTFIGNAY